jgi:hypothetical protein
MKQTIINFNAQGIALPEESMVDGIGHFIFLFIRLCSLWLCSSAAPTSVITSLFVVSISC